MTQCLSCQEEFADRFTFCPVDGQPLIQQKKVRTGKRKNTSEVLLTGENYPPAGHNDGMFKCVLRELRRQATELKVFWSDLKGEPPDDLAEIWAHLRFHAVFLLILLLEAVFIRFWLKLHAWLEEALKQTPDSLFKHCLEYLLYVLLATNIIRLLLFICRHFK